MTILENATLKKLLVLIFFYFLKEVLLWQTTDFSAVRTLSSSQRDFFVFLPLESNVISNLILYLEASAIFAIRTHSILSFSFC